MTLHQHEKISLDQLVMSELKDCNNDIELLLIQKRVLLQCLDLLILGIKVKHLSQQDFNHVQDVRRSMK